MVTGNCKGMGYEVVHWFHVAHDHTRKWDLQSSKEASSCAAGRHMIVIFQNDSDVSGFQ